MNPPIQTTVRRVGAPKPKTVTPATSTPPPDAPPLESAVKLPAPTARVVTEVRANQIYLLMHLGLGDTIWCNGMIRHMAAQVGKVFIPVLTHNQPSVRFMFRDNPKIAIMQVANDEQARNIADIMRAPEYRTIRLGHFSKDKFDEKNWSDEFYRQAGVEAEHSWKSFKLVREPLQEIQAPGRDFALVHEDVGRGFVIDPAKLPKLDIVRITPRPTIFEWCRHIEKAKELHMINSSLAILADMIPVEGQRRVLHQYARRDGVPPRFHTKWEAEK